MTTTANTHETQIIADPDVPAIVIIREFDAPPERVFRAHTDPDLVVQWLGPRSRSMSLDSWDARTGGSYRYLHTGEDGHVASFRGVFHEVRPAERIVQTFTYEAYPDEVCLEKAIFEDLGGRTRLTARSLTDSFETRDAILSSGMEGGVVEGYERLDELLGREV